jgi:DNA-binding NarL/FixJ family response regulator
MADTLNQKQVRILIADDSSTLRRNLKKLLESHSNRWKVCAEAADGMEAVQQAIESKPDMIILDFQMPFMDGLTASARISKSMPKVPILIYTIHKTEFVDLEAKKAGVREVILKSDSRELLRAVKGLLAKDHERAAPKEKEASA